MTPSFNRFEPATARRVSTLVALFVGAAGGAGYVFAGAPGSPAVPAPGGGNDPIPGELLHVSLSAIEEISGPIKNAVAVHADVDGRLDVIAHVGDELVFVSAPDPKQHSASLGVVGVTAMVPVRRTVGGPSAIAAADAGGLEWLIPDAGSARGFSVQRSTIAGPTWAGARSLATADLDADGDLDLLGLDATGTRILRADQQPGEVFVERPSMPVGGELSNLRVVRWNGGAIALVAIQRIAGLSDDSCVLMGLDGIPFRSAVPGGSIVDLAPIRNDATGLDAVAILGQGTLRVIRPGGIEESALDVSSVGPSRLGTADMNADGADDLLLNSTIVDEVSILWNLNAPGAATFAFGGAGHSTAVDLGVEGTDMSLQECAPLGADFDSDGDIDVLQFIEAVRGASLRRNAVVDEVSLRPMINHIEWVLESPQPEAIVFVTVPPMPNGASPDWMEVLLTTVRPGAGLAALEHYRSSVFEDLSEVQVGDSVFVAVPFTGELGETVSLSFRCFTEDVATGVLDGVGVESPYAFVETESGPADGTDNGYEGGIVNQNDPNGTPPPPPPKPIDV